MMIKFLKHGNGACKDAIDYLLSDYDHKGVERPGISVLRGDPYLVSDVADSIEHKKKYTSCVVNWAPEDKPELEQIQHFLDEFELTAFPGLEPDQYSYTAVLHEEESGGVHLHIINAACDLYSGKSLNIAPPGWMKTFDPLRDYFNHHYGWLRPDDPDLKRSVSIDQAEAYNPKGKKELTNNLEILAANGRISHAGDIRFWLNNWGFEITRQGESKRGPYISLKDKDTGEKIRLTGEMYGLEWSIENELERENRAAAKRNKTSSERRDPAAAAEAWERVKRTRERRAEYNCKRYKKKPESSSLGLSQLFASTWTSLEWPAKPGNLEGYTIGGGTKFDAAPSTIGGTDPANQAPAGERDAGQEWREMEVHSASGHSKGASSSQRPRRKLDAVLARLKKITSELAFWKRWQDAPMDYGHDREQWEHEDLSPGVSRNPGEKKPEREPAEEVKPGIWKRILDGLVGPDE